MVIPTRLLTETETSRYLRVSRSFLSKSRSAGTLPHHTPGPPYVRVGNAIRYDIRDLDAWIAANRQEVKGYA